MKEGRPKKQAGMQAGTPGKQASLVGNAGKQTVRHAAYKAFRLIGRLICRQAGLAQINRQAIPVGWQACRPLGRYTPEGSQSRGRYLQIRQACRHVDRAGKQATQAGLADRQKARQSGLTGIAGRLKRFLTSHTPTPVTPDGALKGCKQRLY